MSFSLCTWPSTQCNWLGRRRQTANTSGCYTTQVYQFPCLNVHCKSHCPTKWLINTEKEQWCYVGHNVVMLLGERYFKCIENRFMYLFICDFFMNVMTYLQVTVREKKAIQYIWLSRYDMLFTIGSEIRIQNINRKCTAKMTKYT